MNLRKADASSLIREIKKRKLHLLSEKTAILKRLDYIDGQLDSLASVDIKGSAENSKVLTRAASLTGKKGRLTVLDVLEASSKPLTAKEVEDRLRKKMPAIDKKYASKALSAMFHKGLVSRTGPKNMFRYSRRGVPRANLRKENES